MKLKIILLSAVFLTRLTAFPNSVKDSFGLHNSGIRYRDEWIYKIKEGNKVSQFCVAINNPTKVACIVNSIAADHEPSSSFKHLPAKNLGIVILEMTSEGKWTVENLNVGSIHVTSIIILSAKQHPHMLVKAFLKSNVDASEQLSTYLLKWDNVQEPPIVCAVSKSGLEELIEHTK